VPIPITLHEFASSLLDKVLLGSAALVVGYQLNKRMELFRSRRAMEAEFLRERTRRLDELFGMMLEVEDAGAVFAALALMSEAQRFADHVNTGGAPDSAPDGDRVPRVPPELRAKYDGYWALTLKLSRRAAGVRPWIGDALAKACADYVHQVRVLVDLQRIYPQKWGEKIGMAKKRTEELRDQIVAEIRKGAPPTSKKRA
jgi:hypothetical protein